MEKAVIRIWTAETPVFKEKDTFQKFVTTLDKETRKSVINIKSLELNIEKERFVDDKFVQEFKDSLSLDQDSPFLISVLLLGTADVLKDGRAGAFNVFNRLKQLATENKNYPNHGLIVFGIFPLLGTPENPLTTFSRDALFLNDLLKAAFDKIKKSSNPLNWKNVLEHPCAWFIHDDFTLMDNAFNPDGVSLQHWALRHLLTKIFTSAQIMSRTLSNVKRISSKLGAANLSTLDEELDLSLNTLTNEMTVTRVEFESETDSKESVLQA